jgi:hypothetical protein
MAEHYTIRGGIDQSAQYKVEETYGTIPTTFATGSDTFGLVQSINKSVSRNLVKVRGLSGVLPALNTEKTSRDAQFILGGKTDLTVDVEFHPQTFSFLEYVWGSKSGTGPWNYPQATASTDTDKRKYLVLPSISIAEKFDFGGSGDAATHVLVYTGCKVNTFTMTAAIGEPIRCSLNFVGSDVNVVTADIATKYPTKALATTDPYHFIGSDVLIGATPYTNILDGFEFTLENNCEGIGDVRQYTNAYVTNKDRNFSLKIDGKLENITNIKQMLGVASTGAIGAPIATLAIKLKFSNGVKLLEINLTNLKIADAMPGISYGEVVSESVNLEAEYAYAVETTIVS